jgi:formylglycine-generating enzyme required for sulfatase activity
VSRIFISYRRKDSDIWADRLAHELRQHFPGQVFMDIREIGPGLPWRQVLDEALGDCAALLVVVGSEWLNTRDDKGRRRLEDPRDTLRREVTEALNRGVRVFPVLVNSAEMPPAESLPGDLKKLADLQGHQLTVPHWAEDVAKLIGVLKQIPELSGAEPQREVRRPTPSAEPRSVKPVPAAVSDKARELVQEGPAATSVTTGGRAWWKVGSLAFGVLLALVIAIWIGNRSSLEPEVVPSPAVPETLSEAPPATADTYKVGQSFNDCYGCPEMVVLPAGSFRMGSAPDALIGTENEEPVHEVAIAQPFAVGMYEVTREQFSNFVRETGYDIISGCWRSMTWVAGAPEDPVVCVSWHDAKQYTTWLSQKTGQPYRLLTEAEWEYAARAGSTALRSWGDEDDKACESANVQWCGAKELAKVGQFKPNDFGLYDMLGNASEWVEDCWNDNYAGAPTDGGAWLTGRCERRVMRGGSHNDSPESVRSAARPSESASARINLTGFRVARTLP